MLVENQSVQLTKFSGKGGWTYVALPQVKSPTHTPFGWLTVSGSIDDVPLQQHKLMPMGNGILFLPIRAELRRRLRKKAGDWVHLTLYVDDSPAIIPEEFALCLEESPTAQAFFATLPNTHRKAYVDWVSGAKRADARVQRLAQAMERLERGKRLR